MACHVFQWCVRISLVSNPMVHIADELNNKMVSSYLNIGVVAVERWATASQANRVNLPKYSCALNVRRSLEAAKAATVLYCPFIATHTSRRRPLRWPCRLMSFWANLMSENKFPFEMAGEQEARRSHTARGSIGPIKTVQLNKKEQKLQWLLA